MDHTSLKDINFAVDLESCRTDNNDGSLKGENEVVSSSSALHSGFHLASNVKVLIDKKVGGQESHGLQEEKANKERRKTLSNQKPPKPPRPPRTPSLDAADQQLIREISELAMLKRARIERMKALKKMKASKGASPNSSLFGMVLTVIFCVVLLLQGISSRRSSALSFGGSPESAVRTEDSYISIQYKNISANYTDGPDSGSPRFVEQDSGVDFQYKMRRFAG